MIEFVEVPIHVRLHRSPPVAVRVSIALLGSLVAVLLVAPVVSRVWGRPQPLDALVGDVSRRTFAGIVLMLGMVIGVTLELLVASGERYTTDRVILFNEITLVDAVALTIVISGVFLAGVLTLRARTRRVERSGGVYRQWLLLSIVYPGVLLWALLVIYDVLGITGIL